MKSIKRYETIINEALRSVLEYDTPEGQINEFISFFGKHIGADRIYIFEDDVESHVTNNTYEWCAEGVAPRRHELPNMAAECFPRWHKALSSNQSVVIPDVSAVKEACQSEYDFFRRYGIKSLLAAPFSKRINKGFIVIDEPTQIGRAHV